MTGNPRYPLAEWTPTGLDGGSYIGGPPRGCWHETITAPSAFFTGETYYHVQFRQWPLTAKPVIRQFIPFDRASRALRNLDPGANPTGDPDVQTNRMGSVNINAALVGYQRARSNGFPSLYPLTDAMLNTVFEFLAWCWVEWGIPLEVDALIDEAGQQEYGYDAPHRFSAEEWRRFSGWCGHERVTENTHHDPLWRFAQQIQPYVAEQIGDEEMAKVEMPDWAAGSMERLKKRGYVTRIPDEALYETWQQWVGMDRLDRAVRKAIAAGAGVTSAAVINEIVQRLS